MVLPTRGRCLFSFSSHVSQVRPLVIVHTWHLMSQECANTSPKSRDMSYGYVSVWLQPIHN